MRLLLAVFCGVALSVVTLGLLPGARVTAADWAEARRSIRRDPEPEQLTRGKHYVVSDEERHDLFRDAIAGLGGVFLGVGTNQNYLMAGWARPELLVIVDFDQVVIDLHGAYRALFLHADTPEKLIRSWGSQRNVRERALRLIDRSVSGQSQRQRVRAAYERYRPNVNRHLHLVRDRMAKLGVSCFLDSQEQYDRVRDLYRHGRVHAVRGDFTGERTFKDIGRVLHELGLAVRVLYMSNVEQYISWHRGRFRKNLTQLPFDEKSVVLRTYGFGSSGIDGNYDYFVQPADVFVAWLNSSRTSVVRGLLKTRQPTDTDGLFELSLAPSEVVQGPRRPVTSGNRAAGEVDVSFGTHY